MNEQAKKCLLAMIDGLCKTEGNQYYTEKVLREEQIKILKTFIKNY